MNKDFILSLGIDEQKADAIVDAFTSEIEAFKAECVREGLRDKYARAVNGALSLAGAKNITAAKSVLTFDWDGNDFESEPAGLADAVTSLKESMPYLFSGENEGGEAYSFVGISPAEESDGDISPEELSYSEYMRLYKSR